MSGSIVICGEESFYLLRFELTEEEPELDLVPEEERVIVPLPDGLDDERLP
jgi:hypothetical protein|tara:strand:- start:3173 stop:3325 length:153 start_codon:yes stop_codon:yes gene_type:complete